MESDISMAHYEITDMSPMRTVDTVFLKLMEECVAWTLPFDPVAYMKKEVNEEKFK